MQWEGTIREDNIPYNPTQIALFLHLAGELVKTNALERSSTLALVISQFSIQLRTPNVCLCIVDVVVVVVIVLNMCFVLAHMFQFRKPSGRDISLSYRLRGDVFCSDAAVTGRRAADLSAICVSFIVWRVKWSPFANGKTKGRDDKKMLCFCRRIWPGNIFQDEWNSVHDWSINESDLVGYFQKMD